MLALHTNLLPNAPHPTLQNEIVKYAYDSKGHKKGCSKEKRDTFTESKLDLILKY